MDAIVYGYIITMLAFTLIIALAYLGAILRQNSDYKDENSALRISQVGYMTVISRKQQTINEYDTRTLAQEAEIDKLTEDLRLAKEEINYVNETVLDQEELIKQKDEELGYNEKYMETQQHVLQLSQKEVDDLHRKLKETSGPEYLKACLLESIQEAGNLRHLNQLLEDANASYANDLKLIKTDFQQMMERIRDTEFDQLRAGGSDDYPELDIDETRPDLGRELHLAGTPETG